MHKNAHLKITKRQTNGSKAWDNPKPPQKHHEYSNQAKGPVIQTLEHYQWISLSDALEAWHTWMYPNHDACTVNKPSAVSRTAQS